MTRTFLGIAVVGAVVLCTAPLTADAQTKPTVSSLAAEVEALRAEVAELKAAAATVPTLAQAVEDIDAKLAVIQQDIETLRAQQKSIPDATAAIDGLGARVASLEEEVKGLRGRMAEVERPGVKSEPAAGGVGGVASGLGVSGYTQFRGQLKLPSGFDDIDESTLRIRRARLGVAGKLGGDGDLSYKVVFSLIKSPAALDYYLDYKVMPELSVRAGQYKTQFTRSFTTSSTKLAFVDRSGAIESFRYDRDLQIGVHGRLLDDRLAYHVAVGNGAGLNDVNDNIDFDQTVRVQYGALGKVFKEAEGDVGGTDEPALVVGASFVHDLTPVPSTVSGLVDADGDPVQINTDVDDDKDHDNVRVMSVGVDAAFRYMGVGVEAEWFLRRESWGTILGQNPELEDALDAIGGGGETRNYQGFYGQATYMVLPKRLMVGARFAQSRLPLLAVGGRSSKVPGASRLQEVDVLVQLYDDRFGGRALGLNYTFFNLDANGGADPNGDKSHRIILETQYKF